MVNGSWYKPRLEEHIKRARFSAAALHRTEDLDVARWIEPEPPRDMACDKIDDAICGIAWVGRLDVEEVPFVARREVGHRAAVDPVAVEDEFAACRLAEHLSQADEWNSATCDDDLQYLAGPTECNWSTTPTMGFG